MESFRSEPRNHAGEGDERIRTAEQEVGADSAYEIRAAERERILAILLEAERIDRKHGFVLPGDSALYIALWGLESSVAEEARGVAS